MTTDICDVGIRVGFYHGGASLDESGDEYEETKLGNRTLLFPYPSFAHHLTTFSSYSSPQCSHPVYSA